MMSCGDCDFETHYESELFLHLKIHMGKEDEVCFFLQILQSGLRIRFAWIRIIFGSWIRIRINENWIQIVDQH
jgi:hypothetical protein